MVRKTFCPDRMLAQYNLLDLLRPGGAGSASLEPVASSVFCVVFDNSVRLVDRRFSSTVVVFSISFECAVDVVFVWGSFPKDERTFGLYILDFVGG